MSISSHTSCKSSTIRPPVDHGTLLATVATAGDPRGHYGPRNIATVSPRLIETRNLSFVAFTRTEVCSAKSLRFRIFWFMVFSILVGRQSVGTCYYSF